MKQIIEIEVPDGKKAVWKDNTIVFEDIKPQLPKTWKEFCNMKSLNEPEVYINDSSECIEINDNGVTRRYYEDKNVLPSIEAAEAHLDLKHTIMNENIDLTKILKDCPEGTKFYTPVWGEVTFIKIKKDKDCLYPIYVYTNRSKCITLTKEGYFFNNRTNLECILFPSKDQRDWNKFSAPWYKNEKFDPKTLRSFDRVLVRDYSNMEWSCDILSHIKQEDQFPYVGISSGWKCCIPYNDDTKHLVGTTDEAPEYYRYWED